MKKSMTQGHKTTFAEKLAWGAGGMTESLVNCIYSLSFPIFSISLGVSASLVGLAQSLPRMIDAFTDPLMGSISDNTRTRFGRRRPYILIGAIGCGLIVPLIFRPNPGWSEHVLFAWLLSLTIVFFLFFTVWSIPWSALGLEMSDDYNDRTSLQITRMVFATIAQIAISWAYKLCFYFDKNELIGVRSVTLIVGGIMFGGGVLSALFIKEWRKTSNQAKLNLLSAVKMTLRNRPFLLVCCTVLFFASGVIVVEPMLLYVNIHHVYDGVRAPASTIMGISGTIGVITTVLLLPLGGWLSSKVGKRHAAYIALSLIVVGKGSQYFLVTPDHPYLQIISRIIFQPGIMLMWALVPSMIADICDLDELQTGARREAAFSAVYQWIWKLGATLAVALAGTLLTFFGADSIAPGVKLDAGTIQNLRISLAIVPPLFAVLAFLCIWKYPLTAEKTQEIKEQKNAIQN
jgi:GPH family glycoside/pentoside/hexuronide:cation symporter